MTYEKRYLPLSTGRQSRQTHLIRNVASVFGVPVCRLCRCVDRVGQVAQRVPAFGFVDFVDVSTVSGAWSVGGLPGRIRGSFLAPCSAGNSSRPLGLLRVSLKGVVL